MGREQSIKVQISSIEHVQLRLRAPFSRVVAALKEKLGRITEGDLRAPTSLEELRARVDALARGQPLLIFAEFDHGALLGLVGKAQEAKQFLIGNPLIAREMTTHDLRAGLYAPLRVLVYGEAGGTVVEYDKPSSLLGQWREPPITRVAEELDDKLLSLFISFEQA